jgi:hypothetical protein
MVAEFREERFSVLWRGGLDGFKARNFHDRCDGHMNTLTLIEDVNGNIFGGFPLVTWASGFRCKADPSLKSFFFTLKNPNNVSAQRFALKAKKKGKAIHCCVERCLDLTDITVKENRASGINLRSLYAQFFDNRNETTTTRACQITYLLPWRAATSPTWYDRTLIHF